MDFNKQNKNLNIAVMMFLQFNNTCSAFSRKKIPNFFQILIPKKLGGGSRPAGLGQYIKACQG
jgi:hypothetical protein